MLKESAIVPAVLLSLFSGPLALADPTGTPSTPPPAATPAVSPPPATPQSTMIPVSATPNYQPGSRVTVNPLETKDKNNYGVGSSLGVFFTAANPWSLGLHMKEPGLASFKEQPLQYVAEAYFVAREAGEYSFQVELNFPPAITFENPQKTKKPNKGWITCRYRLSVGNEELIHLFVDTRNGVNEKGLVCGFNKLKAGSTLLTEGLHKTRQVFTCAGKREFKPDKQYHYPKGCDQADQLINTDIFPGDEVLVTLKVRHPKDNTPVMLNSNELVYEKR
jgi:hypothetical protein